MWAHRFTFHYDSTQRGTGDSPKVNWGLFEKEEWLLSCQNMTNVLCPQLSPSCWQVRKATNSSWPQRACSLKGVKQNQGGTKPQMQGVLSKEKSRCQRRVLTQPVRSALFIFSYWLARGWKGNGLSCGTCHCDSGYCPSLLLLVSHFPF